MTIPLVDLKAQYLSIKSEMDAAVERVLSSGNYVMDREVREFEAEWAAACGAEHCVGVSSGTDALYLALRAWLLLHPPEKGVQPVVFAPAFTFIATLEPVVRAGLGLTLKDVDLQTACIRTDEYCGDLFLPVHLYGHPAGPWSDKQPVIEDAAQAHGHQLRGLAMCFSHYPTKNLGAAGQAGSIVTNDPEMAKLLRSLRAHGEAPRRFLHTQWSGNYRLDELQAAILRAKLPHLKEWNTQRRVWANYYRTLWADRGLDRVIPFQSDHLEHVYHIMAARVPNRRRDALARYLDDQGVQTSPRYSTAMHFQPMFGDRYHEGDFPAAETWAREVLTFPLYPEQSFEMIRKIVDLIAQWAKDEGLL